MFTLKTTTSDPAKAPKQFVRVILSDEQQSAHRFIEKADGTNTLALRTSPHKKLTARGFRTLVRSLVQVARSHQIPQLALALAYEDFKELHSYGETWFYQTLAENLAIAAYEFKTYKTSTKKSHSDLTILLCDIKTKAQKEALTRGEIVATYVNHARDIANTTGGDMQPTALTKAAKEVAKGTAVKVTVLNKTALTKLKMGLLLGVGGGAADGPYLIVMEYFGSGKKDTKKRTPTILIGKGITYDTGGLNLKPTGSMHDMHMDMSGGAAVVATIACAAKLGVNKDIVALIPAAENAISNTSMRAGDILTAMNGKTVEVLNTDAEGRLVLADAITYATTRYTPQCIIDVATLTGASLVALGQQASALMTRNSALQNKLITLGETTGDLLWPLPLWDEYLEPLKGTRGDLANMNGPANRYGGAIEGGAFLAHFMPKKLPWAHIDMAPRMDSIPADKLAKGATGEPVRLLVAFLTNEQ